MKRLILAVLIFASPAQGARIVVPDNSPTIQGAIIAASTGDSVLVRPGTYSENVNYLGKGIILKSLAGPATTVIDGSVGGISVVYMRDVPDVARLEGFTLRGGGGVPGWFQSVGGGICVRDSLNQQQGFGPLIRDNWITSNHAGWGGGVYIDGICRVIHNRIYLNEAHQGGGIARGEVRLANHNDRVVSDNEIFSNHVPLDGAGGGASITGTADGLPFKFLRNIVACNDAGQGGGLWTTTSEGMILEGNTIVGNWASYNQGGGMKVWLINNGNIITITGNVIAYNANSGVLCFSQIGGLLPVMACNDFYGNAPDFPDDGCGQVIGSNGNFSADPLFGHLSGCPPTDGDFCLSDDSPLLPENSPPGCGRIGAMGACLPIGVPGLDPAPSVLAIHAARPNPFVEIATIPIDLPEAGEILVTIYNARGEVVLAQPPRHHFAGRERVTWDGRDRDGSRCPPGVYFARIKSGGQEFATRLVLVY
jgi:hypothetical protein